MLAVVLEDHRHAAAGFTDDMVVGDDVTLRIDDEAGAESDALAELRTLGHAAALLLEEALKQLVEGARRKVRPGIGAGVRTAILVVSADCGVALHRYGYVDDRRHHLLDDRRQAGESLRGLLLSLLGKILSGGLLLGQCLRGRREGWQNQRCAERCRKQGAAKAQPRRRRKGSLRQIRTLHGNSPRYRVGR